jgi:hypothetical protein
VLFQFECKALARDAGGQPNFFVADPDWGVWVIAYFYLGGIAAGSYFLAILIEWFGNEEDQALARIAYWIAFPLVVLCGVFLIVDLHRPERFWHMLLKSEVTKAAFAEGFPFTASGWRLAVQAPAFKMWSPMSAVASGLCCSPPARWPRSWRRPARPPPQSLAANRPARLTLQVVGCFAGFFVASAPGRCRVRPTSRCERHRRLAPLFLASAA